MKKKRTGLLIFLIILVLGLVGGVYYLLQSQQETAMAPSPTPVPTPKTPSISEVGGTNACRLEFDVIVPADIYCKAKQAWKDVSGNTAGSYLFTDSDGNKLPAGHTFTPGEIFVYSVIVGNNGPTASGPVNIDDTLPDQVEYLDGDSNCTYTASTHSVKCDFDAGIAGNAEERASFRVQVKEDAALGSFENMATVVYPEKRLTDSCAISLSVSEADSLSCVEKRIWENEVGNSAGSYSYETQITGAIAGDTILYEIAYTSSGLDTITITDTLDESLEFVDSDSECSYNTSTRVLTCTVDVSTVSEGSVFYRAKIVDGTADGTKISNKATVENSDSTLSDTCSADVDVSKTVVIVSPSPSPSLSPSSTPSPSSNPSISPSIASSPAPSALPQAGIMTFTVGSIGAGALLMLVGLLGLLLL